MAKENKQELAITVLKEEDMSEWYTQVIQKADLIDYTKVSGCVVYKPRSYELWEAVRDIVDYRIKKSGVKNCYFPIFIPESLLTKEEEHIEGFAPEVAWVTHGGDTKLGERLAVRPTSETIMYDSFSKWVQSYRDLPLRLNQWSNVVRWEFKHATPFIRGREFLWQEGHTLFETKEEALDEVHEILDYYREIYEDYMAIPVNKGRKSIGEKFAGADYTSTVETFLVDGKSVQGATSHYLGQNFSKSFDVTFLDKNQKKQYPHTNSWAITTRSLGVMIMAHGDSKGIIIPPKLAVEKLVIVPLFFKGKEDKVLETLERIKSDLDEFNPIIDDRKEYSPGFKFNEWELKGVPLRLEIGPRDVDNGTVIITRRDNSEKIEVKISDLKKEIPKLLESMHKDMFNKVEEHIDKNTIEVDNFKDFEKAIKDKKRCLVPWAEDIESEEEIKEKTGAKSSCIPFKFYDKSLDNVKCFYSGKPATCWVYFAKSH